MFNKNVARPTLLGSFFGNYPFVYSGVGFTHLTLLFKISEN